MSFLANSAFQPRVWNNRNNDLQTVTGLFGAMDDGAFVGADCSAGFLCTRGAGLPAGGYQMFAAANGAGGEIYICYNTDVQRVPGADGNVWAVGANTLGLGLPANQKGPFVLAVPGEVYAFGPGDFSTLMTDELPYATISNGLLVARATPPADGSGVYFELDKQLGIDSFVEGNGNAFARYNLRCKMAAAAQPGAGKLSPNLTLSKTTSTISGTGSDTVTATASSSGAISAVSSDEAVATVSVSGGTVTITGVAQGTCTVTVKVAETTTYADQQKTVSVTVTS